MSLVCWGCVLWDLDLLLSLVISQGTLSLFCFFAFFCYIWCFYPNKIQDKELKVEEPMTHIVFPEWFMYDRERNIHFIRNNNVIIFFNFHIEPLKANTISLHLWGLTLVEGQSAGFFRHKELPSLTRLQPSQWGQSAGHHSRDAIGKWEFGQGWVEIFREDCFFSICFCLIFIIIIIPTKVRMEWPSSWCQYSRVTLHLPL